MKSSDIRGSLQMREQIPYHNLALRVSRAARRKRTEVVSLDPSLGRGLGKGIVAIAILSISANRCK